MAPGRLSVLMPNYNDSELIGQALEAICEQSLQADEVIVLDDGSTDNSIEVIEQYRRKYPIIRLERNDRNRGIIYSANRLVDQAQCDYIYCASANDKTLPGLFEKSMNLLAEYPQCGTSCADIYSVDAVTGKQYEGRKGWVDRPAYLSGSEVAERIDGGNLFGLTLITRRSLLVEMGGYRPELRWHCDWFAHHLIALRYGLCYTPEPLAVHRMDPVSYCSGQRDLDAQRQVWLTVLKLLVSPEYQNDIPLVIRGRLLSMFEPVMSIATLVEALKEVDGWNHPLQMLTRHLLSEMFVSSKNKQIESIQKVLCSVGSALNETSGLVKNRCDQAYARAFHEYDRVRRLVREAGSRNK